MRDRFRFRAILPISQTAIALILGGWGLWWRSQILSHSAFGWNSTMVFHVWPWPFRLALILNVPAFLGGALVFWPMGKFAPNLPEGIEYAAVLPFVFVLWYWIGRRLDRRWHIAHKTPWIALFTFTSVCLILSLLPIRWSDFLSYAAGIWLLAVAVLIAVTRVPRAPSA